MAADYGTSNETRYHSSPYSSRFDLINADWGYLALYKLHATADFPHIVSGGGGFNAANSFHVYHSGGVGRIKIDTLAAATSGFTVPTNADVFIYATRRDSKVYCGAGKLHDRSTWVEGSGVSISSAYVPSATDLKIGIRGDQTSSPSNTVDGVISDVIFAHAPLSLNMIGDALFDLPNTKRFFPSIVYHFYAETGQSEGFTDLTGRHKFTRNGTGYGNSEQDPQGFIRQKRGNKSLFLPVLAVSGSNLPVFRNHYINQGIA